jgi:hypothetical protein
VGTVENSLFPVRKQNAKVVICFRLNGLDARIHRLFQRFDFVGLLAIRRQLPVGEQFISVDVPGQSCDLLSPHKRLKDLI